MDTSSYKEALLKYGSDKPDLRNPLLVHDVGDQFKGSGFGLFAGPVEKGMVVRAVPAPGTLRVPPACRRSKCAYS